MAKTDRPDICQQFVMIQLANIKHQLDQCNMELIRQAQASLSSSISNMLPSMEIVDSGLKEYVYVQQKHLFKGIENQLITYKNDIDDQKLYRQLLANNLTTIQQQTIQQIIHLRQVQLDAYEEMIMLKERILHQFLPPIFDELEQYIAPDLYWPPISDHTLVEIKTKHRKILQQGKRTLLNMYMYAYQFKINDYEQQYQQTLNELELNIAYNKITINEMTLFHAIKSYMTHRTDRIKQEIHNKIIHFRSIIARRRQRSSLSKKTIGVSPQVTVDVLSHTLKANELSYLSRGNTDHC